MDADIVVIGAGVIGLAIASRLSNRNRILYLLEKNEKFGQETSSRNSEVIHAGLYYKKNSLKAEFCIKGNRILYDSCDNWDVPYKKIGKLIVSNSDEETEQLEKLRKNALDCGVEKLRFLSDKEISLLEPNIDAKAALFSESTGIIDSHRLMRYFLIKTEENGGEIIYRSNATLVEKKNEGYLVRVSHSCNNTFEFTTKILINAAGLDAHNFASMLGHQHRIYYCKGNYFTVGNGKSKFINHLIYPPPEEAGLGIHSTLDMGGRMRLGPDVEYTSSDFDYAVNEDKRNKFYNAGKKYLPFLEYDDLTPDISGIRPKLQGPDDEFRDFCIFFDPPGAVHLIGIDSPGLTSSPAIAGYVEKLLKEASVI